MMRINGFTPVGEKLSGALHPDHQTRNTNVSYYLLKFGTGKLEDLPKDTRPEVHDDRTVDEMLMDDSFEPSLGTEPVEVMQILESQKESFLAAQRAIDMTAKQKERFDAAIAVLQDSNSSIEARLDAYSTLRELEDKGLITRARD